MAASQTPLEAIAVRLNRSVNSVRRKAAAMEISLPALDKPLPSLDKPHPTIGLKAKGGKLAWIDVDRVSEPGEYYFRDGIIHIKRRHLNIWKKDPDARLTLVRFVPTTGDVQIYGLFLPGNLP
jgi:hypothetical protein